MKKKRSLFNEGMKISIHTKEKGWVNGGKNIVYMKSKRNNDYVLSFEYQFDDSSNLTYFASSLPYTYSNLITYLDILKRKTNQKHASNK